VKRTVEVRRERTASAVRRKREFLMRILSCCL